MAIPNYLGLLCTIMLIPGCMYATGTINDKSSVYLITKTFISLFYRIPLNMITSKPSVDKIGKCSSAEDVLVSGGRKTQAKKKASTDKKN